MPTQLDTLWGAIMQNGRGIAAFTLLVAGLSSSAVAGANDRNFDGHGSGRHEIDRDDFCRHHPLPEQHCIPQPACNQHPSSVPEIDAGAAIGGLALLFGSVMLLRDRALAG